MKETLLLVDDEAGIRNVLGISLTDLGYDVLTAENGEQAFEIFTRKRPAIVLTDIKMPGMDGIDLLKKIKLESPDTEVIMITGHGDMDLAIKSLKHEATDFITKPINEDALSIALKRSHEKIFMREKLRQYTENLEALVQEKSARLVEAERLAAVGQTVEGLSAAIWDIAGNLEGGIRYLNEMPCFVSIHNRELKIVAANALYKQRLGDRVGGNSWGIYGKPASELTECPAWRTFLTGKGLRSKETIEYADGKRLPVIVHTAPIRNRHGDVELVLELCADITEVKRLQEELQATQQRYQQLFDTVPCYITVQDRQFRLTETNRQFKEDFGDETGSHCYRIYKNCAEPCANCPVAKTFKDGRSHQSEMVVTAKNGEQYNLLVSTAPIRDASGEITQVMEMATNISQIRKLQDQLSSLGLLIGSISHGIKGLLTGLDSGVYLLDSGFAKENKEQIEEGWEVVKLMVGRIRSLALDILYYAKQRDLNWERIDVFSFASDVAFTVEPKLRSHHIELVRDFDPALGRFEVDPGVVRSALINILDNAVDACIEDTAREAHTIVFGAKQQRDCIIFEVEDNGIGMDPATREKMFTLFFSSKGNRGTGLGLFISNKIIQQHGGSISVQSTPGEGTRFRIEMPKMLPESIKTFRADPTPENSGRQCPD